MHQIYKLFDREDRLGQRLERGEQELAILKIRIKEQLRTGEKRNMYPKDSKLRSLVGGLERLKVHYVEESRIVEDVLSEKAAGRRALAQNRKVKDNPWRWRMVFLASALTKVGDWWATLNNLTSRTFMCLLCNFYVFFLPSHFAVFPPLLPSPSMK